MTLYFVFSVAPKGGATGALEVSKGERRETQFYNFESIKFTIVNYMQLNIRGLSTLRAHDFRVTCHDSSRPLEEVWIQPLTM